MIEPGLYNSKDFSVADCFKNTHYSGQFKSDTLKSNYVFKGQQIWRSINLDNDQNKNLLTKSSNCASVGLFEIIKFGLFEMNRNAFFSDDFKNAGSHKLESKQLLHAVTFIDTSVVVSFDENGNEKEVPNSITRYLMGSDIKSYLIKEDWIINSYSGKMEKYLIALAPLIYDKKVGKVMPLFWLYYPEWKELFDSFEAKNFYSYGPVSYDDIFTKHYFISQISKETNLFNRSVKSYSHGQDAGFESELIKEKFNNSETDLFQY